MSAQQEASQQVLTGSISRSPVRLFLTLIASTLATEIFLMWLLHNHVQLPPLQEAIVDALSLAALLSPLLYFLLLRPMAAYIRAHDQIEAALRENEEEQYKAMIRYSLDGFWIADAQGHFLEVNDMYCHLTGFSREELLSMHVSDVEIDETPEEVASHISKVIATGGDHFRARHRCKNGQIIDLEVSVNYRRTQGGRFYCFLRDISERKRNEQQLRESESRLKEMFENLRSGVAVYHALDGGQRFVISAFNRAAELIEGVNRNDILGRNVMDVFPGIEPFGLLDVFRRVLESGRPEHFPASFYQDGRISGWRDNYVYRLSDAHIVAIYDDVTEEKRAEDHIRHLAFHDALTGLPNRTLFANRLQQALAAIKREQDAHLALMFLDLDRFKPINDNFGHATGDLLLREVARRIQNCLRESDTVSRLGGDEFVVLLPHVDSPQDALRVGEKIIQTIIQPYFVAGHEISISASIGISLCPDHGCDEKTLFTHADTAMYYTKNRDRGSATLFKQEMTIGH